MLPSDIFVKVDGRHLREFGHVTSVQWSMAYVNEGPCGPNLATVQIDLDPRDDTGFLRMGRTLEVFDRGVRKFYGPISGVGRDTPRTIEAKGWPRAEWDAIVNPTPGQKVGDTTVDTKPRWFLDVSDVPIGVAEDRLFTQVVATYVSALGAEGAEDATSSVTVPTPGVLTEAQRLFGIRPYPLDLTPLGLIDAIAAKGYADQQLREFAIPEWTSRVVTNATRLRRLSGHPAHLPDVKAGHMVRMIGVPASFGGPRGLAATDVILGEVEYSTDSPGEITIAPARVAVRSIADAVRQMAEARKAMEKAA